MLRTIRYWQICLVILKKPGGNYRQRPNNGNMKYVIRVPRNAWEASKFDRENVNSLWANDILKELEALMYMSFFQKIPPSLRKAMLDVYQFAPLWMICYVKVDLRIKARLVIGLHVVNSSVHEVYASNMKLVSDRMLMKIVAENNLRVMTGDIGNA